MSYFRANTFLIRTTSNYFWASEVFKNQRFKSHLFSFSQYFVLISAKRSLEGQNAIFLDLSHEILIWFLWNMPTPFLVKISEFTNFSLWKSRCDYLSLHCLWNFCFFSFELSWPDFWELRSETHWEWARLRDYEVWVNCCVF